MWRRRPCAGCAALFLAALVTGCAPPAHRPASLAMTAQLPAFGTVPVQQAKALRSDLVADETRIHDLEGQLAQRDREIAAVQSELNVARGGTATPESASAPAAAPSSPAAPAQAGAGPPPPAADAKAASGSSAPPSTAAAEHPGESAAQAAPAAAPPGGAAAAPAGSIAPDQRLAEAQKRIVKLQQQLALEVKRRQDVEGEMNRLLQETSAGPFEHADNVVEKHLREELDRARKEVGDLRATLLTERRERGDLERRFAALQAQAQAAAPAHAASSEEIEALKQRQRRVLASIEQDLEASRQREAELRQTIESSNGSDAVSLADAVSTLRSENSALQTRLDDEHQHNRDLSAKLLVATRVTDLIFKMRTGGVQPAVAALPTAAR